MDSQNNINEVETIIEYSSKGNRIRELSQEERSLFENDNLTANSQSISSPKTEVPGVFIISDEGRTLHGKLSTGNAPGDGPPLQIADGQLAWNPHTKDLVCLGKHGKGIAVNLAKKTYSTPFRLEGGNNIFKVRWNNDKNHFIAVGRRGSIYLSEDARQWERQEPPTTATLIDVSWSTQLKTYVVVGTKGTILTSKDGKAWEIKQCALSNGYVEYNLICIARSDEWNKYVVIHENPNYKKQSGVLTSTDGLTWEYHPSVMPAEQDWNSIAWSRANKRFVAVGSNRSILSSDDGLEWSGQQLPKRRILLGLATENFDFNEVIYSQTLNAFVAVGTDFTAYYSFSGNTEKSHINKEWLNLMQAKSQFSWMLDSKDLTGVSECDVN